MTLDEGKAIEVQIEFRSGVEPSVVTPMGGNVYRMEFSRLCAKHPDNGDLIECAALPDGTLRFKRIVKCSGLQRRSYLISREFAESEKCVHLLEKVVALGGNWERNFGGWLVVYLPCAVDFRQFENEILSREGSSAVTFHLRASKYFGRNLVYQASSGLCKKIVIGYYFFVYDFLYRARSLLSDARPLIGIICFLAVPVFTILAYRAWAKTLRVQLSPWRSNVAVTSMVAVSANWLYVILMLLLHFINDRWASSLLNDTSWDALFFLALAAALQAIALKGLARIQGIAAGVLMAAFWLSTFGVPKAISGLAIWGLTRQCSATSTNSGTIQPKKSAYAPLRW